MSAGVGEIKQHRQFRAGDVVRVRSYDEIRSTLDRDDALQNLPFMPEMAPFCGKTFRVSRRADRVCVEGASIMGKMDAAVFLEALRCDGSAHDGCQRGCLILWKEAWLESGDSERPGEPLPAREIPLQSGNLITLRENRFYCQSTQLKKATTPLPWWDARQYVRDVATGNLTPIQMARTLLNFFLRKTVGAVLNRIKVRQLRNQGRTPTNVLNLQPGELVQVKSLAEITATLDARGCNRGLEFSPGMSVHCGGRYRVLRPLNKIIVEKTGDMREISSTVILEGLACTGACSRGCPRGNYMYWREVWLKRADEER